MPAKSRIDKQTRDKKHQRHKKHIVEVLRIVEKRPPRYIHYRSRRSPKRLLRIKVCPARISKTTMVSEHHQRQRSPQIIDGKITLRRPLPDASLIGTEYRRSAHRSTSPETGLVV